MTDITPNHPAVEAANMGVQEWLAGDGPFNDDPVRLAHEMTAVCVAAALPHLTADDLRNTPAGRKLMAEGWEEGVADNERGWQHVYAGHDIDPDDPLAICQTCGTPNPYLEATR